MLFYCRVYLLIIIYIIPYLPNDFDDLTFYLIPLTNRYVNVMDNYLNVSYCLSAAECKNDEKIVFC